MTNLESLQSIFVNRAFLIPDYQRGYAWEVKQRKDLLNDLEDLEQVQSTVRHYTGTIVLHRGSHPAQNVRGQRFDIVDIVDGQQRITTLVILLLCISQRLRGFQDDAGAQEIAKTLEDGYICRSSVQGSLYRLKLNGGTDLFFRDHILGQAPIPDTTLPAHANLWNAKFEFQEYLTALCERAANDTDRIEICIALSQRITDRLGFVVYEVDNEAEVGVMFEVMNARGKALTQMEKVKNFLLYLGARVSPTSDALAALSQEVNDTWRKLLEAVVAAGSQGDEDQFLRYHWAIYPKAEWYEDKRRSRTFDIHRAVKHTLTLRGGKSPEELSQGISDYLTSTRSLVVSYRDVLNPLHPLAFGGGGAGRNEIVDRALSLKRIGRTATVLPILMAAHNRFSQDTLSLNEIFRLAEVFVFRLAAVHRNANTGDSSAYTIAADIMAGRLSA